jgi:hypothetical protein
MSSILNFFTAANGIAQLWARNGQFLGLLSSNQYDQISIINPNTYGNSYYYDSIQNLHGIYGGEHGIYSPYNIQCITPPVIVYQNQPVLVVTRNPYVLTNGLQVVDPDFMLSVYAQLANSYQHPASSMHSESYRRTVSASNAELINSAIQTAMLFAR